MADHPLRPATDHRLGRPLPHQLAHPTRAPLGARNLCPMIAHRDHAVLAEVSLGYPPLQGRFPRATHPCATPLRAEARSSVRLACVKHAASVRSEPGSNSHVHPVKRRPAKTQAKTQNPAKAPLSLGPLSTQKNSTTQNRQAHPAPSRSSLLSREQTASPRRRRPRIPSHNHNVNQQTQAARIRSGTRRRGGALLNAAPG